MIPKLISLGMIKQDDLLSITAEQVIDTICDVRCRQNTLLNIARNLFFINSTFIGEEIMRITDALINKASDEKLLAIRNSIPLSISYALLYGGYQYQDGIVNHQDERLRFLQTLPSLNTTLVLALLDRIIQEFPNRSFVIEEIAFQLWYFLIDNGNSVDSTEEGLASRRNRIDPQALLQFLLARSDKLNLKGSFIKVLVDNLEKIN
jgi:hypothetical protein